MVFNVLSLNAALRPTQPSDVRARRRRNRRLVPHRVVVRRSQQRRVPHQRGVHRRPHQIIPPAKTSTGFERDFSSAISGFRSLCGRKQRSFPKPSRSKGPASWNPLLGAGSRFENSGLCPYLSTGPVTLDRCWAERSRSRAIFQVIFLHSNRALSGQFPPRNGSRDACQIGLWRPFGR